MRTRTAAALALGLLATAMGRPQSGSGSDDGGDDHGHGGDDASSSAGSLAATGTASASSPAASGNATSSSDASALIGMKGGATCSDLLCLGGLVNGSSVTYTLQSLGSSSLGWMAMGFGSQMANTPMVIMWPNSDGTITLSQRKAPQEVMPTLDASPPRTATPQPALSSLSGSNPKLVFTIPAASSTSNTVIWAFSNVNPDSNANDATLQIHLNSGPITLDISQTLTSGSKDPTNPVSTIAQTASGGGSGNSTSTSTPSVSDGIPLLPYQKYIVAHAILLVVGFLFLLPLGAIIARYLRTFSPVWFKLHWIIQWVLALPLIVTGFALGVTSVNMAGVPHQNDTHKRWGVAIFVVYIMQLALGAFVHFVKIPVLSLRGRAFQNYFHAVLGIFIVGASFYQVRTGFRTEWPLATGRGSVGNGANIVWIVWLVLILVVYFAGMLFLPRQYKQEEDYRRVALKSSEPSIEMVQGQQRPARTY